MSPLRILGALVKFSLVIGLAGGLVDLTRAMMFKAADAQRVGLVSLHDLNQSLFGSRPRIEVLNAQIAELAFNRYKLSYRE